MCEVAQETAVNNQVLVFIGDKNVFTVPSNRETLMYKMLQSVITFQIKNILLVATDHVAFLHGQAWITYMKDKGIPVHAIERDIDTPGNLRGRWFREQQSAKKFPVLRDLLKCHVNLLLSDFDVLFWDNPFNHIVGDAEVEAMTDGWDYGSMFGWELMTPVPIWFPPWEWRVEFLNSGFFYLKSSVRTIEAMDATWTQLTKENIWDQAAFNCQVRAPLGTPKNSRYHGQGLRIRVMDAHLFPNSRVFHSLVDPKGAFSEAIPGDGSRPPPFKWPHPRGMPVAMHVNYHRQKVKMMAYARNVFNPQPPVASGAGHISSGVGNHSGLGHRSAAGDGSAPGARGKPGNRSVLGKSGPGSLSAPGHPSRPGKRSSLGRQSR